MANGTPDRAPNGAWLPGQSANPNGRPRNQETFKALFERELRRAYRDPQDEPASERLSFKEKMVRTAVRQAVQGNLNALVEIINRLEGKVPDRVDANLNVATTVIPWVPWDDPGAAEKLGLVYVESGNQADRPDSGRLRPPPDATDQTPPWTYRDHPELPMYPEDRPQDGSSSDEDGEGGG